MFTPQFIHSHFKFLEHGFKLFALNIRLKTPDSLPNNPHNFLLPLPPLPPLVPLPPLSIPFVPLGYEGLVGYVGLLERVGSLGGQVLFVQIMRTQIMGTTGFLFDVFIQLSVFFTELFLKIFNFPFVIFISLIILPLAF